MCYDKFSKQQELFEEEKVDLKANRSYVCKVIDGRRKLIYKSKSKVKDGSKLQERISVIISQSIQREKIFMGNIC